MAADVAKNVLTHQTGTVSALRDRRGEGPFRTYDVPPAEMMEVVEAVVRRARDARGEAALVHVSARRREVVAREGAGEGGGGGLGSVPSFTSAVVVMVNPVPGHLQRSRVEVHATHRGPFHRGTIAWEQDVPRWIEEELASRARARPTLLPIP
jgi:hypothetical protein